MAMYNDAYTDEGYRVDEFGMTQQDRRDAGFLDNSTHEVFLGNDALRFMRDGNYDSSITTVEVTDRPEEELALQAMNQFAHRDAEELPLFDLLNPEYAARRAGELYDIFASDLPDVDKVGCVAEYFYVLSEELPKRSEEAAHTIDEEWLQLAVDTAVEAITSDSERPLVTA